MTFRFDAAEHRYWDLETGAELQHITGLLGRTGWIDDAWMTEEGRDRGVEVHRLCAAHDLNALDLTTCDTLHRGYLLAYLTAIGIMRPEILEVERPYVHPTWKFGGRPDRVLNAWSVRSVLEIKTGAPQKADAIQLALQAILIGPELGLPPTAISRFALYLRPDGRFRCLEQKNQQDFVVADDILQRCCRG